MFQGHMYRRLCLGSDQELKTRCCRDFFGIVQGRSMCKRKSLPVDTTCSHFNDPAGASE